MGFALSLSGLNGASRAIDVIGNNIANSQTVGFKSSKARFADVLAAAVPGDLPSVQVGSGVSTAIVRQQMTEGTLSVSDNPLDMAITGLGFFRLNTGGEITYSRDGQFRLVYDATTPNKLLLVNRTGANVTGYPATYSTDPLGTIDTAALPQNVAIDTTMPAAATTTVTLSANLDSREAAPVAPFSAGNPQSYNATTMATVYDGTGATHDLRMYFVRSAPGNLWQMYSTMDGGAANGPVALSFDTAGKMQTAMPLAGQTYTLGGGGSLTLAIDFSGVVQYGQVFNVDAMSQDGYGVGSIDSASGFSVGSDGVIQGQYTNGQVRKVGQIVLANFVNPDALINIGDGQWSENLDPVSGSGKVTLSVPGGAGLGGLQGGAVEQSNVDLSTEMVALIEQQRNYQASAQTFKILDQVLQDLANIR